MTIVQSELLNLNITQSDSEKLQANLAYPKIVIFENVQKYRIVDLVDFTETIHKEEYNIIDKKIKDDFLWLVLKSGELVVIDISKALKINIHSDKFKICCIKESNNEMYLMSESGECLKQPYNKEELRNKFNEGVQNLNATFTKTYRDETDSDLYFPMDGLNFYIQEKQINMLCPLTGLVETISVSVKCEHLLNWGNTMVLADEANVWLLDTNTWEIMHKFAKNGSSYIPITVHDNVLYYMFRNTMQVQVCSASISNITSTNKDLSSTVTTTTTSQDALMKQLELCVETILTQPEITEVPLNIKTLFEEINHYEYLVNISLKLCQHNIIFKSLLYPLQKKIITTDDTNLLYLISDLLIKVDLLEYIFFKGNKCYKEINVFEQNVKELCINFILKSDLDLASICWLKYSGMNIVPTTDDVIDILNSIPYNTKISAIMIWLKNFIPTLLDQNPFYIDIFVRWATERIFKLEQSTYWPKIGIKFIDEITTVLQTSLNIIPIRPISMDDLDVLKDRVLDILELKEKYKIHMLLSEFSSQSPCELTLIMLRRCYTEDLETFLINYLSSYATRQQFDLDDALRSFIESEAASGGGEIDGVRLNILLHMFRSMNGKLDCLLQVLKVLDVPWNPTVIQLAKTATTATNNFTLSDSDRDIIKEIFKEFNYSRVKVILKKYNFPFISTDYKLLIHKIINASKVDVSDLKVITHVISNHSNYGNVLYLNKCIQDSEIRAALDYFADIKKRDKIILLKAITVKYEQLIMKNANNVAIERNYIDFLKGTNLLNHVEIKYIESLFYFKNSYNINFDMNGIHKETSFNKLLIKKSHVNTSKTMSRYGERMTYLTGKCASLQAVILTSLRRTPASHNIHSFVEKLINQYMDDECDHNILSNFEDCNNVPLLLESCEVTIDLLLNCNEEHLHYIMKYLTILNAMIKINVIVKNLSIAWKFNYIYLPISSTTEISSLINFYTKIKLPCENEYDLQNNFQDVKPYDFNSFRMISHILVNYSSNSYALQVHLIDLSDSTAKRILNKITVNSEIDEAMVMSLLLILRTLETTSESIWVPDALRGQSECFSPPVVCFLSSLPVRNTFCLDSNINGNSTTYPPQLILKSKFNINLSEIALPEHSEETWDVKVILFYVLRQHSDIEFKRLSEICHALNVPIDDGLSLQLISLLTNWNVEYKISENELGSRQIILENNEESLKKCYILWESIQDKEFLIDILNDFWKNGEVTLHGRPVSINPYYYEVFLCIYRLIFGTIVELRNMREYFLLNFLTEYTRRSAPKQYEFELFSVKGIFPEIGYFRLPFHLFMRDDMWSNLKSEITLETYERWLPVVVLLALDSDLQTARDMICSNALKQTMTSRKRNEGIEADNKKTEPWSLITREEPLLRAAHKCVRHISNMEWAGACLFYVLQGCSRGADQVAAAHLCYQFAQRWAAVQPGNRAVLQMERLNCTLSTRHVLYKIEWARDELVRLSTEPAQLIRALYFHPGFIEKIGRHDVNRAANEIADKNGINVSSIRMQILENILDKATKENNNGMLSLNTVELITAKYILKATCPKMGAIYLSRIAFDDDSSYKKSKKLRALQCLMSVVDADTAIKVTNRERDALWLSLFDLLCVVKLEAVDMPWIVVTFLQAKSRSLDQLIRATDGNVEALKTAIMLACKYASSKQIHDLIILLLRTNICEDMTPLLLKTSTLPPDGVVYAAWRSVILSPFKNADHPITERQRAKCINAINLLPLCPILKDEDLKEVWKNCVRCKCLGLGCLILPYMTPQTRQTLPELLKIDRRNLIASLKNLHNESYLVSGAMHVIEGMASKMYR